jgi:hypothetical protein
MSMVVERFEGSPRWSYSSRFDVSTGGGAQRCSGRAQDTVRERPKLEPAMAFIDAALEAEKKAPRKQRHTAHRIWCRIRVEMPEVEVAESTTRRHVRGRKIELAMIHCATLIPQS